MGSGGIKKIAKIGVRVGAAIYTGGMSEVALGTYKGYKKGGLKGAAIGGATGYLSGKAMVGGWQGFGAGAKVMSQGGSLAQALQTGAKYGGNAFVSSMKAAAASPQGLAAAAQSFGMSPSQFSQGISGLGGWGNVLGGLGAGYASYAAGENQADATMEATKLAIAQQDKALAFDREQFEYQKGINAPYQAAGLQALPQYLQMASNRFQPTSGEINALPWMKESKSNLEQMLSRKYGGFYGGAELVDRAQQEAGLSRMGYQDVYSSYTDQGNRLANVAGYGQTANSNLQNASMNASQNMGQGYQNIGAAQAGGIMGAGAARSAGYVGMGSALQNMFVNAGTRVA